MVRIDRLPENIPIEAMHNLTTSANPPGFYVVSAPPEFRILKGLLPQEERSLRYQFCYGSLLLDGEQTHELRIRSTKTFETVATFLAKYLPETITDLEIRFGGYNKNQWYDVFMTLTLNGQPSAGTLAWLSFLRSGWEFITTKSYRAPTVCVPAYIVQVLNSVVNTGHMPIPSTTKSGRPLPVRININQLIKLLVAIRDGRYDREKWTRGLINMVGKEVLGL